ncbi:hypothetical protein J2W21_000838 [Sinomonas atrocyanea]|uniref:chain-length determining protein n=1 Tax=Sinomonas atrocyanea TaxID=37927 RepID=UPI0027883F47|nr:chain-length determining protein [Sinomonas atrocyanea]MDP9883348.1 hypothetical protein [Sinomonas atrocyanea]
MESSNVFKIIWRNKWFALPILLATLAAVFYVVQVAPRRYESIMTYAVINPQVPSQEQLNNDPALRKLNSNNPYLRSSDNSLIVQSLITKLNDKSSQDLLAQEGHSVEYQVIRGGGGNYNFLVDIKGVSSSPADTIATTAAVGKLLENDLYAIQKVEGADNTYLFTSLVVSPPTSATEQFSSRLRSAIAVAVAGLVLMFGLVAIVHSTRRRRQQLLNFPTVAPASRRSARAHRNSSPVHSVAAVHLSVKSRTRPASNDKHTVVRPNQA